MKLLTILFLTIATVTSLSATNTKVSAKESTTFAKCRIPTFEESYQESKAIFVGKVLSVRKEGDQKIFRFRVEKYWKGKKSKTLEVQYYENMRYQAWLEVGKKYLVYARANDDGTLFDGRCSLTKNYSESSPDVKKLGKGKVIR